MRYVLVRGLPHSFLSPLAGNEGPIVRRLRDCDVLFSGYETRKKPTSLDIVSKEFQDRYECPLLGGEDDYDFQLSPN
jgi:hypothetical protein